MHNQVNVLNSTELYSSKSLQWHISCYPYFTAIYKKRREGKVPGAQPNFPQLAKDCRTEQVSKAVRVTDEITLVFIPPESYWFKMQVTQVPEKSNSN